LTTKNDRAGNKSPEFADKFPATTPNPAEAHRVDILRISFVLFLFPQRVKDADSIHYEGNGETLASWQANARREK